MIEWPKINTWSLMRLIKLFLFQLGLGSTFILGCSHPTPLPKTQTLSSPLETSTVSIDYILGHERYQFVAKQTNSLTHATTYMDKKILNTGKVDAQEYMIFFNRAILFTQKPSHKKSALHCRSPYKILVQRGKEAYTSQGCRNSDDGSLSKLLKEGEFLLLSSKN